MARPSKKKKGSLVKRLMIVAGALLVVQIALFFIFDQQTASTSIREEINRKVDQTKGVTAQRRELLKLQLALNDYRIENGSFPASLDLLVPKYFDKVPVDPETSQPFKYSVDGVRFLLGDKQAAAGTAQQPAGAKAPGAQPAAIEAEQQLALIATLDKNDEAAEYVYDPTNKREPFRPFEMKAVRTGDCAKEPLTCFDISQLRLAAVMTGLEVPKASIEDSTGRGYLVGIGSKIGLNGGEVAAILPDRVKIVETTADLVTGAQRHNVIDMELRTRDLQDTKKPAPRAQMPQLPMR